MIPQDLEILIEDLYEAIEDFEQVYYASRAALLMAELLEVTDGERKQRRVKSSLRDDAIDELLKRDGFTW